MAAWHQKALVHAGRGDMQSMRATLDECLRRSPVATSCLQSLANLEANEGNCEETERLARIQLANGPPSRSALLQLATSIQSRGGAPEAVRAALDRSVAAATPETKRRTELFDNMVLEVLGGAFAQALATGDAWTAEIATSPYEEDRATLSKLSMYVPLELGNRQLAAKRAADFLVQRELWIPGPYFDYKILALRVQYLSGAISKATFVRERETWLQREAKKPRLVSNRGLRWTLSYARAVSTPDDAREALEALADYLPVTDPATRNVESDDAIGYTYFLAGRVDEGLPYLRRGARSCKAVIYPFEHTWANLHLGMALEKKGDVAGACGAYEVVRARWGNEPKSQSANFARSRQSTLGCVPARPQ
jgi:serine/threonine-protein kinase